MEKILLWANDTAYYTAIKCVGSQEADNWTLGMGDLFQFTMIVRDGIIQDLDKL